MLNVYKQTDARKHYLQKKNSFTYWLYFIISTLFTNATSKNDFILVSYIQNNEMPHKCIDSAYNSIPIMYFSYSQLKLDPCKKEENPTQNLVQSW